MATWKLQGYLPVKDSIIMDRHDWYIEADFFEAAQNEAYKRGARNIFKIEKVTDSSTDNDT